MKLQEISQAAVYEVDKRVTKKVGKILIGLILIGFLAMTIIWLPDVFIKEVPAKIAMIERSMLLEGVREIAKEPFDWKATISWIIGSCNGMMGFMLLIKKVFGKEK